jgi:Na+/proline symporter
MSAARRLLILGGISLALLGMIYGLWYAVFAEHQELDGIGKSLATGFSAAAERNAAASSAALRQYKELKYAYDRHVDIHSHWIGLAMLLIVLGIASDRLEFGEHVKLLLSAGLLVGSLFFPLGVLLQTYSHGDAPRAIAVAGSALVIVALTGMTMGFARAPRAR